MSNVLFVATTGFDHGIYKFGRKGDSAVMPESTANDLQRAGLGTIKAKPKMANKMLPDSLGNAGGQDAQSSSVRPGPASQETTSKPSAPGRLSLPPRAK